MFTKITNPHENVSERSKRAHRIVARFAAGEAHGVKIIVSGETFFGETFPDETERRFGS